MNCFSSKEFLFDGMSLESERIASVLDIFSWPVFHAEKNSFQQIQIENCESLKHESFSFWSKAKAANEGKAGGNMLDKGKWMIFQQIIPDFLMQDTIFLKIFLQLNR